MLEIFMRHLLTAAASASAGAGYLGVWLARAGWAQAACGWVVAVSVMVLACVILDGGRVLPQRKK